MEEQAKQIAEATTREMLFEQNLMLIEKNKVLEEENAMLRGKIQEIANFQREQAKKRLLALALRKDVKFAVPAAPAKRPRGGGS